MVKDAGSHLFSELFEEDKKPKLDPKQHYFWVDRKLAYLPSDALSKKALRLYLLYARSCNPKWLVCSMASYNAALKSVGLSRTAVDIARDELLHKGFIRFRTDVKSGCFKTTPVEVLPFPALEGEGFSISQNGHRSLKNTGESVISMPSKLIDGGWLKGLSLLDLRTLLFIYAHCRLRECLGVDCQVIHAWNRNNKKGVRKTNKSFGGGFHPSIKGKTCYEVVKPKQWWASEQALNLLGEGIYKALNHLIERFLLITVPVVVWTDPEDEDITEVTQEIFQGLVQFNGERAETKYRIAPLEPGDRIIWIARPRHLANNTDYQKYVERTEDEYSEAVDIY